MHPTVDLTLLIAFAVEIRHGYDIFVAPGRAWRTCGEHGFQATQLKKTDECEWGRRHEDAVGRREGG